MTALNRQVTATKASGLVPYTAKLLAPKMFLGEHDNKAVHTFINACETYFMLTGVSDIITQVLFTKTRLNKTARTWYDI